MTALVLFSGGQDSATCLAWALREFGTAETIGFAYGQRHVAELTMRPALREAMRAMPWGAGLGADHTLDVAVLGQISDTALTRDMAITMGANGLPNTFVPGRNLLFLTLAAAVAYRRGLQHIVTGVCETDYSGYPDCRDDTIKAMQVALNLGLDHRFVLHTPLMWIDKAATWRMAERLGGTALVELIRAGTLSCYQGELTANDWGPGCGTCPACELRRKGWEYYELSSPKDGAPPGF